MAATYQKLTVTAATELECCFGRLLEPGHLPLQRCLDCGRETWHARGYVVQHEAGGTLFVPAWRGIVRHLTRFQWVGVTHPTEEEARALVAQVDADAPHAVATWSRFDGDLAC
jgi:hypothetical protein